MGLKDRIRPQWVKTARKLLSARLKLGRLRRRFGLPPISGNPLAAVKSSDTLFVLGSGGSINTLTPADWQAIAAGDTVGLNFWLLHDFVPKAYVFEPAKGQSIRTAFFRNLSLRAADYRDTLLYMKDGERFREEELAEFLTQVCDSAGPRTVLSLDWELRSETPETFRRQLRRLERSGWLTSPRMPLPRMRASIFTIVLLALRAGYRRIVLCGVDLSNSNYFYDAGREELTARGFQVPVAQPAAAPHLTDNASHGALTVSVALNILKDEVLAPRGIELMVALESSKLYPMLPSYFGHS